MPFTQPRAGVYQGAYYEYETVAGTFVTPTKRVSSLAVGFKPNFETDTFRASGSRIPNVIIPERVWTDISMSGVVSFAEAHVPLDLAYSKATATLPTGGTASKQRIYAPDPFAPDTNATASIIVGNPGTGNAESASGCILTALGYKGDLKSIMWDGLSGKGQGYTPNVSIPASPTTLAILPAARPTVRVFSSTSNAFTTNTKLTGVTGYSFKHDNIRDVDWTIDADQTSYSSTFDTEATATFILTLHRDAVSRGFIAALTAATRLFFRVQALGGVAETGVNYLFQHDLTGFVSGVDAPDNANGALDWTITLTLTPDPTWGTTNQFQAFKTISMTA